LTEGQFSIWKTSGDGASIVPGLTVHHAISADATELAITLKDKRALQLLFSSGPEQVVLETTAPDGGSSELVTVLYDEQSVVRQQTHPPQRIPSSIHEEAAMHASASDGMETVNKATVNTPGDGFLALRSEPSLSVGTRLLKIPHGAQITLGECVAPSHEDRWCKTTYRGTSGWVFARYLNKAVVVHDSSATDRAITPAKGDPLRQAILDAVRVDYPRPVVFMVHELLVRDAWAWAAVEATVNGRREYEPNQYVVRKQGSHWKIVDSVNASDPETVDQVYRRLRAEYPDAPIPDPW
jgi:uncharacterized protein YraI